MAVTAPPRPPETSESIDRDGLEALIQALIEEARQRARRRRRRIGTAALLVALATGGVYLGFHDGGGAIGSQAAEAGPSGGAASGIGSAVGRWRPAHGPDGGPVYVVATAPSSASIIYVGTARGAFASRNGGRTWRSAGLAVREGRLTMMEPRITSIAVDPRSAGTVYATRGGWVDGGQTLRQELFKTSNGGRSWRALGPAAQRVAVSPSTPRAVFAVVGAPRGRNRLFRSADGGRSWLPADRGLAATSFVGVAFDPTAPATVYAATTRGVLRSIDGGISVLQPANHESAHADLGNTMWFHVFGSDGQIAKRGAWQHVDPPPAGALRDTVAFAWRAMDAFYEESERVLGHAADPYHRIDVRRTSRHLVVRDGDQVVADTHAPLVLYESGFAPRWYVPRTDIVADGLEPVDGQTFCPYKGLASYYNVGGTRTAAWSYRAPFEEVERITDLVSFYPEKLTITLDGEKLEPAPGQNVLPHGPDRNLSVDEIGGIRLMEHAVPAEAGA